MISSTNETLKGTRPPVNWRNFATCLFIGFGMAVFSYITGIIGSTLTNPSFLLYMGLYNDQGQPTSKATQRIGATTGVYQVSLYAKSFSLSAHANELIGWWYLWDHNLKLGIGQNWPSASSVLFLRLYMHLPIDTGSISKHWNVHCLSFLHWSRRFRLPAHW